MVLWVAYRTFFRFPEWVDEVFVKAVVFGTPAWLYARSFPRGHDVLGLSDKRFWRGMFIGLLIGGFYEFIAILTVMFRNVAFGPATILSSPFFWYIFGLALMTAWWESLFFFGYVLNACMEKYKKSELVSILISTGIFLLFHAPLRVVSGGFTIAVIYQLALLGLFAVGQAILYLRTKSIYAITMSHALWGLVLLVYA